MLLSCAGPTAITQLSVRCVALMPTTIIVRIQVTSVVVVVMRTDVVHLTAAMHEPSRIVHLAPAVTTTCPPLCMTPTVRMHIIGTFYYLTSVARGCSMIMASVLGRPSFSCLLLLQLLLQILLRTIPLDT